MAGSGLEPAEPATLSPKSDRLLWLASILGASGVLFGAFGAHSLARFAPDANLSTWRTAVLYHLIHALAVFSLVLYRRGSAEMDRWIPRTVCCWALGILLFSGSLYALATGIGGPLRSVLGPLTPLGGLLMITGWLCLLPIARTTPRLN